MSSRIKRCDFENVLRDVGLYGRTYMEHTIKILSESACDEEYSAVYCASIRRSIMELHAQIMYCLGLFFCCFNKNYNVYKMT